MIAAPPRAIPRAQPRAQGNPLRGSAKPTPHRGLTAYTEHATNAEKLHRKLHHLLINAAVTATSM